jgi:GNAT superfamily N-acetyltransferase
MLADDDLGRGREDASSALALTYQAAFESIATDANQLLIVAERVGEIVGSMQITFIPGISRGGAWRGHFEAVRVARPYRALGVGRQMLKWAIDECKLWGCRLVQLTSNKARADAHRFYESLGFTSTHVGMKLDID